MIGEAAVWAIFLLPLASFLLIALIIRPFLNRYSILSGLTLVLCLTIALGLSLWVLWSANRGAELTFPAHTWLDLGHAQIQMGLLLDPLTNIMLVVVTGVSLMIQIYSLGYMRHDPSYSRYFAYMSLFTAAMLGLVLAANIIQLYVFWELVGVSSYLLIGFWHHRSAAAAAAKKAFIVTRIGDVGFLMAIIYLFFQAEEFAAAGLNALHIPDIWLAVGGPEADGLGILTGGALTWVALGIFAGAAGKSGQFPLHTWLPDAMEGPTPVSALIHAATMVAAGVFLVGRFFPLFQQTTDAMTVVALIGAFTAFMAATLGLVMNDIKRVMAYSTISQLGYMMAGLGMGAYAAAIFHLFTHAFFKALLFLCAGSVNHATGTFNMRYMGGLRRHLPWTYALMIIGGLSLVGIVPLAGFWSKDEILLAAWLGNRLLDNWVGQATFTLLLAGVLLTAFYTFRMIYLTFHGEFRGGGRQELLDAEQAGEPRPETVSAEVHLAESPWVMLAPMVFLGFAAVVVGYVANPQGLPQAVETFVRIPAHWLTGYLAEGLAFGQIKAADFSFGIALASTVIALLGIALASRFYLGRPAREAGELKEPLELVKPLHTLLAQKYYLDALFEDLLVRRWFYRGLARLADWLDRNLVDGFVDLIGGTFRNTGRAVAQLQTGQVQFYGAVVVLGAVLILLGYLIFWSGG